MRCSRLPDGAGSALVGPELSADPDATGPDSPDDGRRSQRDDHEVAESHREVTDTGGCKKLKNWATRGGTYLNEFTATSISSGL